MNGLRHVKIARMSGTAGDSMLRTVNPPSLNSVAAHRYSPAAAAWASAASWRNESAGPTVQHYLTG